MTLERAGDFEFQKHGADHRWRQRGKPNQIVDPHWGRTEQRDDALVVGLAGSDAEAGR